jgi:hypothetical protein
MAKTSTKASAGILVTKRVAGNRQFGHPRGLHHGDPQVVLVEEPANRILIRYEAHLSRDFDRSLSQLERLQRIRLGQAVPPTLRLEI